MNHAAHGAAFCSEVRQHFRDSASCELERNVEGKCAATATEQLQAAKSPDVAHRPCGKRVFPYSIFANERFVDDYLRGDSGEFAPLPSFHLLERGREVPLPASIQLIDCMPVRSGQNVAWVFELDGRRYAHPTGPAGEQCGSN